MLLAPLSLPPAVTPARRTSRTAAAPQRARPATARPLLPADRPSGAAAGHPRRLLLWALAGMLLLVLVPAFRPGPLLGWTLPFWLVLAPLLNLVWLTRRRWPGALRAIRRATATRRPAARRVATRRTPLQGGGVRSRRARSAAVTAERSTSS